MGSDILKTVLIVEDSGIDRDLLKVAIERRYRVITAENGYVAETILESGQEISIILLDIIMPVVNGFDFLEWIQSKPQFQHIPIVFTSLAATDENILKGLKLGVRDVFVKPYDLGQVLRCIDNLLTLAEYQKNACVEEREEEIHTILIVDDSLLSRSILKETLRGQYNFMEATNGLEALELLRSHNEEISLVLLDMIMPKMDGYEVMKIAMAEKLVENIPVVAVTSEEGQESYVRMLEMGVREVVKKPFSPLVVQGKFKNLIDLYRYGRAAETVTPPAKGQEEKKNGIFSSGMFHLKFQEGWENIFVSDSCLELFGCTQQDFLSRLCSSIVCDEATGEDYSLQEVLQSLSKEPGSCSYISDIAVPQEEMIEVKIYCTSFQGADGKLQLYGMLVNISEVGGLTGANVLMSEGTVTGENKERMLCRYIIRGRRAIINSIAAKQMGIPDVIDNMPEWNVKHGYIHEESIDTWYGIFDEIDSGKQYGTYEIMFKAPGSPTSHRCRMEFTGMTDGDQNPSGALIYYEYILEEKDRSRQRFNTRSAMTLVAMKHFYEIASVNLTKGTCHLVHNNAMGQQDYAQDLLLEQILQKTYQSVAPEYQEAFKNTFSREAQLSAIAKGQDEYSLTFLRRNEENEWVWIETVATRQYNPYDDDILVCIVSRMVDERKVQEQLLLRTLRNSVEKQEGWEQYEALSAHIFHGLAYADYDDGRPTPYFIGDFANVLGCTPRELALALSTNIAKEDRDNFEKNRKEALQGKVDSFVTDYRVKTVYGTWVWVSNKATRFKDKKGNEGYIYFLVDSTYEQTLNEQIRVQKKEVAALRQHVQTDQISGTYSREYFLEKAQEMIDRDYTDLYIVRLNICHFRVINELQGTQKCDRLLWEIGHRLKMQGQREGFVVGRFASDRFYLCIPKDKFEQIDFVKKATIPWLGMEITLNYGVYPVRDYGLVNVMCDRADMALNANRKNQTEYIHYYNEEFHQKMVLRREIESEMENALAKHQFGIYIQPKFDVDQEDIVGGEVLVRWFHPEKGMISPGVFISVFEKNGFIRELDYYIWEESCRFITRLKEKGISGYPLSVNVSRIHFYGTALEEKWLELLEKYKLDPKDLELEVTESICDENPDMIIEQCKRLRKIGFKISMDDFGSGYSSLNMLRKLPLDILKMDLKFLEEDGDREEVMKGRDILRTQIELAHTIGLDVIVEGVETKEQKDFIKEIGSCAAQGYFYARPMPAVEFEALLEENKENLPVNVPSQMAAKLRRERLRQEQLQPMLEVISAGETIFGYLLPEKVGILPKKMARDLNCPQRVDNLVEHLVSSGIISSGSIPQCMGLMEAVERGDRSGSAIIECEIPEIGMEPHWLRFDTVLDYEGNPLIAMFIVEELENITSRVKEMIINKQS